ncbi:putative esterase [compost metagenome]
MKSSQLFTALLISFLSITATAAPQIEDVDYSCDEEVTGDFDLKYCITKPEKTNSPDIIYFLHGLNGSERSWFRDVDKVSLQALWIAKKYKPTIISVSLGPQWLIIQTPEYPVLDLFMKDIFPRLEKKTGGLKNGRRILIGQSMGGFNGVQLAMNNPDYFSKVALWCPAITTVGPYDSPKAIQDYISRTGANPDRIRLMLRISRAIFTTEEEWNAHDPIRLIRHFNAPAKPALFTSIGRRDEFGFQEGSQRFAQFASQKGFSSVFKSVSGPHCRFDLHGASDFIIGD